MLQLLKRGSTAGLAAGAAVALVVLVYDLIQLEPLATPKLLSENIFGSQVERTLDLDALSWIAAVMGTTKSIAIYTMAHFAVFAALGVLGAWVFRPAGVPGNLLTGALFGMAGGSATFYAGHALLAPSFVAAPAWGLVLVANALAGIVIVSQLVDTES